MKDIKLYNRNNHDLFLVNDKDNVRKFTLVGNYFSVSITEDEIKNNDGSKTRFIYAIDPDGGPNIVVGNFLINYTFETGDPVEMCLERIEINDIKNGYDLYFKETEQ